MLNFFKSFRQNKKNTFGDRSNNKTAQKTAKSKREQKQIKQNNDAARSLYQWCKIVYGVNQDGGEERPLLSEMRLQLGTISPEAVDRLSARTISAIVDIIRRAALESIKDYPYDAAQLRVLMAEVQSVHALIDYSLSGPLEAFGVPGKDWYERVLNTRKAVRVKRFDIADRRQIAAGSADRLLDLLRRSAPARHSAALQMREAPNQARDLHRVDTLTQWIKTALQQYERVQRLMVDLSSFVSARATAAVLEALPTEMLQRYGGEVRAAVSQWHRLSSSRPQSILTLKQLRAELGRLMTAGQESESGVPPQHRSGYVSNVNRALLDACVPEGPLVIPPVEQNCGSPRPVFRVHTLAGTPSVPFVDAAACNMQPPTRTAEDVGAVLQFSGGTAGRDCITVASTTTGAARTGILAKHGEVLEEAVFRQLDGSATVTRVISRENAPNSERHIPVAVSSLRPGDRILVTLNGSRGTETIPQSVTFVSYAGDNRPRRAHEAVAASLFRDIPRNVRGDHTRFLAWWSSGLPRLYVDFLGAFSEDGRRKIVLCPSPSRVADLYTSLCRFANPYLEYIINHFREHSSKVPPPLNEGTKEGPSPTYVAEASKVLRMDDALVAQWRQGGLVNRQYPDRLCAPLRGYSFSPGGLMFRNGGLGAWVQSSAELFDEEGQAENENTESMRRRFANISDKERLSEDPRKWRGFNPFSHSVVVVDGIDRLLNFDHIHSEGGMSAVSGALGLVFLLTSATNSDVLFTTDSVQLKRSEVLGLARSQVSRLFVALVKGELDIRNPDTDRNFILRHSDEEAFGVVPIFPRTADPHPLHSIRPLAVNLGGLSLRNVADMTQAGIAEDTRRESLNTSLTGTDARKSAAAYSEEGMSTRGLIRSRASKLFALANFVARTPLLDIDTAEELPVLPTAYKNAKIKKTPIPGDRVKYLPDPSLGEALVIASNGDTLDLLFNPEGDDPTSMNAVAVMDLHRISSTVATGRTDIRLPFNETYTTPKITTTIDRHLESSLSNLTRWEQVTRPNAEGLLVQSLPGNNNTHLTPAQEQVLGQCTGRKCELNKFEKKNLQELLQKFRPSDNENACRIVRQATTPKTLVLVRRDRGLNLFVQFLREIIDADLVAEADPAQPGLMMRALKRFSGDRLWYLVVDPRDLASGKFPDGSFPNVERLLIVSPPASMHNLRTLYRQVLRACMSRASVSGPLEFFVAVAQAPGLETSDGNAIRRLASECEQENAYNKNTLDYTDLIGRAPGLDPFLKVRQQQTQHQHNPSADSWSLLEQQCPTVAYFPELGVEHGYQGVFSGPKQTDEYYMGLIRRELPGDNTQTSWLCRIIESSGTYADAAIQQLERGSSLGYRQVCAKTLPKPDGNNQQAFVVTPHQSDQISTTRLQQVTSSTTVTEAVSILRQHQQVWGTSPVQVRVLNVSGTLVANKSDAHRRLTRMANMRAEWSGRPMLLFRLIEELRPQDKRVGRLVFLEPGEFRIMSPGGGLHDLLEHLR